MKIKSFIIAVLMMIGIASNAQDAYIAEIRLFAGNFEPQGWAFCNGQTLSISQNQALFALIGTTYGGDGRSTFKLPDLRSRVPVHAGFSQAPGLSQVILGEQGGVETNVVTPSIVTLSVTGVSLDTKTTGRDGAPSVVQTVVANNVSQNQELKNRQPYLGLNYIICLQGIFPPRN
jgi:microcystin-dependent protein